MPLIVIALAEELKGGVDQEGSKEEEDSLKAIDDRRSRSNKDSSQNER